MVQASGQDASCLHGEVFWECPSGRRTQGIPRTRWGDYISWLVREHLGVPPEELVEVVGERGVWISLLRLFPCDPDTDKRQNTKTFRE